MLRYQAFQTRVLTLTMVTGDQTPHSSQRQDMPSLSPTSPVLLEAGFHSLTGAGPSPVEMGKVGGGGAGTVAHPGLLLGMTTSAAKSEEGTAEAEEGEDCESHRRQICCIADRICSFFF